MCAARASTDGTGPGMIPAFRPLLNVKSNLLTKCRCQNWDVKGNSDKLSDLFHQGPISPRIDNPC